MLRRASVRREAQEAERELQQESADGEAIIAGHRSQGQQFTDALMAWTRRLADQRRDVQQAVAWKLEAVQATAGLDGQTRVQRD